MKFKNRLLNYFTLGLYFVVILAGVKMASAHNPFVNDNGEVTEPIVELMEITGIFVKADISFSDKNFPEAKIVLSSRKLEDVVPAVQGKIDPSLSWFGDASKERWQKDDRKLILSEEQAKKVERISDEELNLCREINANCENCNGVLFLGGSLSCVRKRLLFLNNLFDTNKALLPLPIYILTGERKLEESIGETKQQLHNPDNGIISFRKDWMLLSDKTISDEGEMIKLVFDQSHHASIDANKVTYVYSPKGEGKRATTEGTIIEWLDKHTINPGNYIAVSHQPYTFYQECVIKRVLLQKGRSDVTVRVVGPEANNQKGAEANFNPTEHATNQLNNISRILYELLLIEKMQKNNNI